MPACGLVLLSKKNKPSAQHSIDRRNSAYENMIQIGVILTEIGATYKLNSHWAIATDYRYSNQRQLVLSYDHRHRYQIDLSWFKQQGININPTWK